MDLAVIPNVTIVRYRSVGSLCNARFLDFDFSSTTEQTLYANLVLNTLWYY